ncbi:MAG: ribulose-phosphate 3-epimerase [archaeon]
MVNLRLKIGASILSADFSRLGEELKRVENADLLHFDVMDNQFVDNLTFGPPVLKSLKTSLLKDCHLMVSNPLKLVKPLKIAGADLITFHCEVCKNDKELMQIIEAIKSEGMKVGIALNPDTKLERIESVLDKVDLVLCMTVFPGFEGQKFMEKVMPKIQELRKKFGKDIQVDGGIDNETIKVCAKAGANVFVSGSHIFKSSNPKETIKLLKKNAANNSFFNN